MYAIVVAVCVLGAPEEPKAQFPEDCYVFYLNGRDYIWVGMSYEDAVKLLPSSDTLTAGPGGVAIRYYERCLSVGSDGEKIVWIRRHPKN